MCENYELDDRNKKYLIEKSETEVNDEEGDKPTETEGETSEEVYEKHKSGKSSLLKMTLVAMMLMNNKWY